MIRFAVVHSIKYNMCRKTFELLSNAEYDVLLFCGGLRECFKLYRIERSLLGINRVGDDTAEVKFLKNRDSYLPGRIVAVAEGVCIAGIDGINTAQSKKMLLNAVMPENCKHVIILSAYPPLGTRCAIKQVDFCGVTLRIGLDFTPILEKFSKYRVSIVSCSEDRDMCFDVIGGSTVVVNIPSGVHVISVDDEIHVEKLLAV